MGVSALHIMEGKIAVNEPAILQRGPGLRYCSFWPMWRFFGTGGVFLSVFCQAHGTVFFSYIERDERERERES